MSVTHIENDWHVIEIELVLLLVVLLQLGGVVVLALLCYVCSHMSLLFGLEPNEEHNKQIRQVHPTVHTHTPIDPHTYFFNIGFCGVDVLIGLLSVLRRTLRFSPFPLEALFTLVCGEKIKMERNETMLSSFAGKPLPG